MRTDGCLTSSRARSACVAALIGAFGIHVAMPALAQSAPGARATPYSITPGVRSTLTWSDNGALAPRGQERDDLMWEVAPFVEARADLARAQGVLRYSPRYLTRSLDVADEGLRHELSSFGNVYLISDTVGINASASVFDTNESPFAASTFDPARNPDNRAVYKRFDLSPYARGRLTPHTRYGAQYRFGYVDPGGQRLSQTEHQLSGSLENASVSRLGWRLAGSASQVRFDGGFDYQRQSLLAVLTYAVDPTLRLGAGVNCSRSDILLSPDGADRGCGPSVTVDWIPTTRTQFNGTFSNAYYGYTGAARMTHRAQQWVFGLDYRDAIVDPGEATSAFDPRRRQAPDAALAQQPDTTGVLPDRSALAFGTIQSALVRNQGISASVGYSLSRTNYGARVFFDRQTTDINLADNLATAPAFAQIVDQYGFDLQVGYQFGARNSLGAGLRTQWSETPGTQRESRLGQVTLNWRSQLSRVVSGGLAYRYTTQRVEGTTGGYDENALIATLEARF